MIGFLCEGKPTPHILRKFHPHARMAEDLLGTDFSIVHLWLCGCSKHTHIYEYFDLIQKLNECGY